MVTRGKQANGLYEPSKASRPHLNGENGGGDSARSHLSSSPCWPTRLRPRPAGQPRPRAMKVTVMSNPLRRRGAAQAGAPAPHSRLQGLEGARRGEGRDSVNPLSAKPRGERSVGLSTLRAVARREGPRPAGLVCSTRRWRQEDSKASGDNPLRQLGEALSTRSSPTSEAREKSDGARTYPCPKHNRPLCTLFCVFCSVTYHLDT